MILRKISTDHLKLGRSRCSNIELFLAKPLLNGCGLQHGVAHGLAESRAAGAARTTGRHGPISTARRDHLIWNGRAIIQSGKCARQTAS
jgi:hypothetical protein